MKEAAICILEETLRSFHQQQVEYSYGYYRPSNPHDFMPDFDSCTPKEIETHKADCEAYDRGEYKEDKNADIVSSSAFHITRAPWGIGTSRIEHPEFPEVMKKIEAIIEELRQ